MGFAGPGVFEEFWSPSSCDERVGDLYGGVESPIDEVGALCQGEVTTFPTGGVGNVVAVFVIDRAWISEKPIKRRLQNMDIYVS